MDQYTPGRITWKVRPGIKTVFLISDAPGRPVVMDFSRWGMQGAAPSFRNWQWGGVMHPMDTWLSRENHHVIDHPDARRLTAVWNACEGFPTEHLQPGAVKALVDALEGVMHSVLPADRIVAYANARAAIAKAKGETVPTTEVVA